MALEVATELPKSRFVRYNTLQVAVVELDARVTHLLPLPEQPTERIIDPDL